MNTPYAIVPKEGEEKWKTWLLRGVRDHMWEKKKYTPPVLDAVEISLIES